MASCLISPSACNLKWLPGASHCLQVFSGRCLQHAPIPLLLRTRQTLRDAQLHTDNTVLHVQFRKPRAHEQKKQTKKQCSNCKTLQSPNAHTLNTRHTSIRTCQLANPSSLFLPQCAHIFSRGCTMLAKIFIFADFFSFFLSFFFFFLRKHKRNHTSLSPWLMPK